MSLHSVMLESTRKEIVAEPVLLDTTVLIPPWDRFLVLVDLIRLLQVTCGANDTVVAHDRKLCNLELFSDK